MGPVLVFLEFADEAKDFIRFREENKDLFPKEREITIIALSMAAQLELKRTGIPFRNTLSFFNNDSHADVLIRSEEWLTEIEKKSDCPPLVLSETIYAFRFLVNYLLWTLEIVINSIELLSPQLVMAPVTALPEPDDDYRPGANYRPLGLLARETATKAGVTFMALPIVNPPPKINTAKKNLGVKKQNFLKRKVSGALFRNLVQKALRSHSGEAASVILIGSCAYGLGEKTVELRKQLGNFTVMTLDGGAESGNWRFAAGFLIKLLRHKKIQKPELLRLPARAFPADEIYGQTLTRQTEELFNLIENLGITNPDGLFHYRGFDLTPFLSGKLRGGLRNHVLKTIYVTSHMKTALETILPCLILSPHSAFETAGLGVLAGELGIPSLLIPHGSLAAPRCRLEEIAWKRMSSGQILGFYGANAAQTPLAAAHAAYFNKNSETFNTGSILWAVTNRTEGLQLREKLAIRPETAVIVYAVAQRKRTSIQFQIFETEDEYLDAMTDLVHAINKLENVHLILKLHPSSEFSEEDIRLFLPPLRQNGLSVLHREPFSQVLSAADLLVSYISTTVEEAALNRIPVVLYDKWRRYRHGEAFDCDREDFLRWPAAAAYYTGAAELLPRVIRHGLDHANQARSRDDIYSPYCFRPDEVQKLDILAKHLMKETTER